MYLAPELVKAAPELGPPPTGDQLFACDMWALGATAFVVIYGEFYDEPEFVMDGINMERLLENRSFKPHFDYAFNRKKIYQLRFGIHP